MTSVYRSNKKKEEKKTIGFEVGKHKKHPSSDQIPNKN